MFVFLLALLFVAGGPLHADSLARRQTPTVVDAYNGGFRDDYLQELQRVRTYLPLAQQEIAAQLGLSEYAQGFLHPVTVRFYDGAPAVSETPFFFVQPGGSPQGSFSQELGVNVEAFARHSESAARGHGLRNGFYYVMTELILNDVAGGDPQRMLPIWVQEGLAVFCSSAADEMVKKAAAEVPRSKAADLVGELNRPAPYLSPSEWARYGLAVQYIVKKGGSGALQAFVRDMLGGRSTADAVLDVLSQDWATFEVGVKAFSLAAFEADAVSDDTVAPTSRTRLPPRQRL